MPFWFNNNWAVSRILSISTFFKSYTYVIRTIRTVQWLVKELDKLKEKKSKEVKKHKLRERRKKTKETWMLNEFLWQGCRVFLFSDFKFSSRKAKKWLVRAYVFFYSTFCYSFAFSLKFFRMSLLFLSIWFDLINFRNIKWKKDVGLKLRT